MQLEIIALVVRVVVEMVNTLSIEQGATTLDTVYRITFLEQELSKVSTILTSNTRNQRYFLVAHFFHQFKLINRTVCLYQRANLLLPLTFLVEVRTVLSFHISTVQQSLNFFDFQRHKRWIPSAFHIQPQQRFCVRTPEIKSPVRKLQTDAIGLIKMRPLR